MARYCTCTPERSPCPRCLRRERREMSQAEIDATDPLDTGWQEEQDRYERQLDVAGGSR